MLDWKTNTCSFVATEEIYEITGSFENSLTMTPVDGNRWDWNNQAHGVLNTKYTSDNDNESNWMDITGEYDSFAFMVKNYLSVAESYTGVSNGPFRAVIRVAFDDGKN